MTGKLSDVCHWFLLSVQNCDYMKFLASYFDSKSREVQEEMWSSFVIGSTLKPRMFRRIFIYLLNTKYHKKAMAITTGDFTALHLLMCTAVKWIWTISGTSHKSSPSLWTALCSGFTPVLCGTLTQTLLPRATEIQPVMLNVTLLKESGLWPGVQINFSMLSTTCWHGDIT